jgi:spore coat polysaccharide biosynthesis protein SpsF
MRIGAVIQARSSSRRLPGKVLRLLRGKPMIAYLVERLQRAEGLNGIVLATSTETSDDALAGFVATLGIACYRGALDDVGARVLEAARAQGFDALVRVNGDSPLLDPALVARGVAIFREDHADLVTNVRPRSFPKGQSVEVIRTTVLAQAMSEATEPGEHEHVTPFLYAHPDRFRIVNFAAPRPRPELQLSVDTPEDFARIEAMLGRMSGSHLDYGVDALIQHADAVDATLQAAS